MAEVTILNSSVMYENRWMTVREDKIRRADGSDGIYGIVDKPDFVLIIPLEEHHVHLVEQFRYPVGGRYLEFPQGSWETQRTADPLLIAAGELREETGLIADQMDYLGHVFTAYGYSTQGMHVFVARGLHSGAPERSNEEQDLISRRYSLNEFESMLRAGRIKDASTLAAWTLLSLSHVNT